MAAFSINDIYALNMIHVSNYDNTTKRNVGSTALLIFCCLKLSAP